MRGRWGLAAFNRKALSMAQNFLAIIRIGAGGSTHQWEDDPQTAARKCAKRARQDWARLYDIPKGHRFRVTVYDGDQIPDGASVAWGASSAVYWHDDDGEHSLEPFAVYLADERGTYDAEASA